MARDNLETFVLMGMEKSILSQNQVLTVIIDGQKTENVHKLLIP